MVINNIPLVFHHYYQLAFSDKNFSLLEKKILENYAFDMGITKAQIERNLLQIDNVKIEDFSVNLNFLYGLYVSVCKHYVIDENILKILKKYCIKIGFYNSNIDELSKILLINAQDGVPFDYLLSSLKI